MWNAAEDHSFTDDIELSKSKPSPMATICGCTKMATSSSTEAILYKNKNEKGRIVSHSAKLGQITARHQKWCV